MPLRSESGHQSIWPRPYVWVWLAINIAWLQVVVPFWIVSNNVAVLDPATAVGRKLTAGFVAIVVIPFAGVLGFALLSLALCRWVERLVITER